MRIGKPLFLVLICISLSAPAEARPRIFRMLGMLAAPIGIIAGAGRYRGHHHYVRASRREPEEARSSGRTVALADWAGPLYWPYAYDDLFDFVFSQPGADARFWGHGYDDVLDGMFVSASVNDDRLRPAPASMQSAENGNNPATAVRTWQDLCGSQTPDAVDRLIESIRATVQPSPKQANALDGLRNSLTLALNRIQAACPNAPTEDARGRLDSMAARLLSMRQAAILVLTPLRTLYAALNDEQKARLNAPAPESSASEAPSPTGPTIGLASCTDATAAADWPAAKIARQVRPTRDQVADLEMLRQTSAYLAQFVAKSCAANKAQSPPDRLDTALKRINVLRYAVTHASPALDQVYYSLSPAQKARFAALGR